MSRPRLVLDTNVVLSALLFANGRLAPLRLGWQAGLWQPLASTATVRELIRVLAYPKFKLDKSMRDELLADCLPHVKTVHIPHPLPQVPLCRDPADRPFLHLAAAGQATALITGDKDLLALAGDTAFEILSPDAWLRREAPA